MAAVMAAVNGNVTCPVHRGCDPPAGQAHLIVLDAATGDRRWAAPIPSMKTFVCNEQIPNILSDGTLVVSGGTYGGVRLSWWRAARKTAAWPKYGGDAALTGRRSRRPPPAHGVLEAAGAITYST